MNNLSFLSLHHSFGLIGDPNEKNVDPPSTSSDPTQVVDADPHIDECFACGLGEGELLVCDFCPLAYHHQCIGLPSIPSDDVWRCPLCKGDADHSLYRNLRLKMIDKSYPSIRMMVKAAGKKRLKASAEASAHQGLERRCRERVCAFCRNVLDDETIGLSGEEENAVSGPFYDEERHQWLWVHTSCALWAPKVYFVNGEAHGVVEEFNRSRRLFCYFCKQGNACVGCYIEECPRSFHIPCAKDALCYYDELRFRIYCPDHAMDLFMKKYNVSKHDEIDIQQLINADTSTVIPPTITIPDPSPLPFDEKESNPPILPPITIDAQTMNDDNQNKMNVEENILQSSAVDSSINPQPLLHDTTTEESKNCLDPPSSTIPSAAVHFSTLTGDDCHPLSFPPPPSNRNRSNTHRKIVESGYDNAQSVYHAYIERQRAIFLSKSERAKQLFHSRSNAMKRDDELGKFMAIEEKKHKNAIKARVQPMPLIHWHKQVEKMRKEAERAEMIRNKRKRMLGEEDEEEEEEAFEDYLDYSDPFSMMGGLENAVLFLKESVLLPLMYNRLFKQLSIEMKGGVLLYGPPGTGKTSLVRCLAYACDLALEGDGKKITFFARNASDIVTTYIGDSEATLRELFKEARKRAPSLIFFDEIDAIASARSPRDMVIHASIVTTLLTELDGITKRGDVFVIAATNRIDALDPALRRPGRFDREIYVPPPSQAGRKQILRVITRSWKPKLSSVLLHQLAKWSYGYTGADLRALCCEALLHAANRLMPTLLDRGLSSRSSFFISRSRLVRVEDEDFKFALDKVIPSHQRSETHPARILSPILSSLLAYPIELSTVILNEQFPLLENPTVSHADKSREEIYLQSSFFGSSKHDSFINRSPIVARLMIDGNDDAGQHHLTAAILRLQILENFTLFELSFNKLIAHPLHSSALEYIADVFRSAINLPRSIIFIPAIDQLWDGADTSLRAALLCLLADLRVKAGHSILILSSSNCLWNQRETSQRCIPHELFAFFKSFIVTSFHRTNTPTLIDYLHITFSPFQSFFNHLPQNIAISSTAVNQTNTAKDIDDKQCENSESQSISLPSSNEYRSMMEVSESEWRVCFESNASIIHSHQLTITQLERLHFSLHSIIQLHSRRLNSLDSLIIPSQVNSFVSQALQAILV